MLTFTLSQSNERLSSLNNYSQVWNNLPHSFYIEDVIVKLLHNDVGIYFKGNVSCCSLYTYHGN